METSGKLDKTATAAANNCGALVLAETDNGICLCVKGDWILPHYSSLQQSLTTVLPQKRQPDQLDFGAMGELDTAGAALLTRVIGAESLLALTPSAAGLSSEYAALLKTVATVMTKQQQASPQQSSWLDAIARLGELSRRGWRNFSLLAGFMGLALTTLFAVIIHPGRWRITALVTQIHQTGLNAVAIVALLTFLVGAVVAFLGATVLANFGASIYTVNLVAYSFLREFGVLLTAILLAGRTASAFTAQIGSMKVNEEIDALRTLGLNPMEILVVPRILALLIILPLLTFIAMISGIVGGAVVGLFSLDISLARYMNIVQEIPVRHFYVGMAKAPIFAFMIALIGCLEGFKVQGSAQSVGEHTTSSVVQSIFIVIVLDAVAALFCMEMGW